MWLFSWVRLICKSRKNNCVNSKSVSVVKQLYSNDNCFVCIHEIHWAICRHAAIVWGFNGQR